MKAAESLMGGRVAGELRQAILSGALAPGSRIRQEDLALRFGSSRIPVREALRQLEAEGLVTLVANSGAWVAWLDRSECLEIYQIRERLEPLALGESLSGLTPSEVEELGRLAAAMEVAPDVDSFLQLDKTFHLLSYRHAGMPALLAMIERFWNTTQQYRRAYSMLIRGEGEWITHHEHRLLVEAIRRGDRVVAESLLQLHIRRTRQELGEHPELFAEPGKRETT
jgi:DNA-binding GntR family transcriptional regulator